MTTKKLMPRLFAAAVLATGCADDSLVRTDDVPQTETRTWTTEIPTTLPEGGTRIVVPNAKDPIVLPDGTRPTELRLRGVNAGEFASLLLRAKSVEVHADDILLARVEETGEFADLANEVQAWKLASFVMPEGTTELRVTVELDDVAAFRSAERAGDLDVRSTRLDFTVPAEYAFRNEKAVVVLDAGRSVLDLGNGRYGLVPQYRVMF